MWALTTPRGGERIYTQKIRPLHRGEHHLSGEFFKKRGGKNPPFPAKFPPRQWGNKGTSRRICPPPNLGQINRRPIMLPPKPRSPKKYGFKAFNPRFQQPNKPNPQLVAKNYPLLTPLVWKKTFGEKFNLLGNLLGETLSKV